MEENAGEQTTEESNMVIQNNVAIQNNWKNVISGCPRHGETSAVVKSNVQERQRGGKEKVQWAPQIFDSWVGELSKFLINNLKLSITIKQY